MFFILTGMDDRGPGFVVQAKRKLEMDSPSQRPTRRRLSSACSSIGEDMSESSALVSLYCVMFVTLK